MTYTVHAFDPTRPAFYTGEMTGVEAGNITGARKQVAARVNGTVDGNIVRGPNGVAYDIFLEKKREANYWQ